MAPKNNKRRLRKKENLKREKAKRAHNNSKELVPVIDCFRTPSTDSSVDSLYRIRQMFEQMEHFRNRKLLIPENSTVNELVTDLRKSKINNLPKTTSLDILEQTVFALKSETHKDVFKLVLQKLFTVLDRGGRKKREMSKTILDTFFDVVEDSSEMKLTLISEKWSDVLLPRDLLNMITKKENVEEGSPIARGGFGIVRRGRWRQAGGSKLNVIIKSAVSNSKELFLKREAIIMSQLRHKNIVTILAFVKMPMQIIMENLELGDLKHYLMGNIVPQQRLYRMIIDIVSGMEYLSEKQYVHRDLTLQNIFVNFNFDCKIGDFGLSIYVNEPNGIYKEQTGRLDSYSVAPEARITQQFSTKTDVWALGVAVWEMFYLNYKRDVDFFGSVLVQFYFTNSLLFPPQCPDSLVLYITDTIMHPNPEYRPTFTEIREFITRFLQ